MWTRREFNTRMRELFVVSLALASPWLLIACADDPAQAETPESRQEEVVLDLGNVPEEFRWMFLLPELELTREEAMSAVEDMRVAVVDDSASDTSWLEVTEKGSFIATGYLGGNPSSWPMPPDGTTYCLDALHVIESVGDLEIVHAIPLVISDDTPVVLEGETTRYSVVIELYGVDEFWFDVEFSVQDGWIRADSLVAVEEMTPARSHGRPPPVGTLDEMLISLHAGLSPAPGRPWLEIESGGETITLEGYTSGSLTWEPEGGLAGSIDLTIPDRMGPAAVYHVVKVFFTDSRSIDDVLDQEYVPGEPEPMTEVHVNLTGAELVATGN